MKMRTFFVEKSVTEERAQQSRKIHNNQYCSMCILPHKMRRKCACFLENAQKMCIFSQKCAGMSAHFVRKTRTFPRKCAENAHVFVKRRSEMRMFSENVQQNAHISSKMRRDVCAFLRECTHFRKKKNKCAGMSAHFF